MQVKGLKCRNCGDFIYSRATLDLRYCSCGNIAVEGGFEGLKIIEKDDCAGYEEGKVELGKLTRRDLWEDWNDAMDRFGRIEKKEPEKEFEDIEAFEPVEE